MESDIKLVDLRKESLNVVREAIKLAASIDPTGFRLFINKNFIKAGLVTTKLVPVSDKEPPASQEVLNLIGLKNLKATLDFAKKTLGDAGEVDVVERPAPVLKQSEAPATMPDLVDDEDEVFHEELAFHSEEDSTAESEDTADSTESEVESEPEAPKKRGRKKASTTEETVLVEGEE
jgi:hypothetical protein